MSEPGLPDGSLSQTPPMSYLVRHGVMRHFGEFKPATPDHRFEKQQDVILRTERGIEVGQVICPAHPAMIQALVEPTTGTILRVMTAEDRQRHATLLARRNPAYDAAAELIRRHSLPMQLVDVEHLFGGERVVFFFLAEKRVDFRELVKSMAREFQTRIELRQIGVRDEAKLLADYGDCGRPVCCNTHMVVMPSVSMRMAKLQKSTLDPSKISGRCGRLKCCLRFEQDVYEEFQKQLPPINARILTRKGKGRVVGQEILNRMVLVEFEDGRRLPVQLDEILTRLP
ncbi:PSP1 domain-containing protein [Tuwongella immobilis]|uniref:PSP1 C-terminal domain-containing protein n=1 Tax=Tuwongella immobilis TaxID=692036 RepID=A0A6C2YMQ0_9BACT|nr:regulatory iron-sulfur-containing complex subunit RicT [Tuwongella immobilis]VIP02489.1 Signal peptidase-like protein OS=Blastopirellula marina DSM 3645 GN=DSM3645_11801 PE=4 SV=1: PSP1 [Tuwongella immobilis]VTS01553.1 Signal peptidase-like protein OS=Blastopirellula marina DSM 3645 GN=DSM3645_11801 PE=4 SV=1: PSP1 [Tuwongella immobilis]